MIMVITAPLRASTTTTGNILSFFHGERFFEIRCVHWHHVNRECERVAHVVTFSRSGVSTTYVVILCRAMAIDGRRADTGGGDAERREMWEGNEYG